MEAHSNLRATWLAKQNGRKATLYVIRLTGHGETFYKVGITYCFASRFNRLNLPYQLRTMARYSSRSAGRVYDLEQKLHALLKGYQYIPTLAFSGHLECFSEQAAILPLLPKSSFILKHVTNG